jgi:NhaA family Na+:H+ antiporter
MSLTKLFNDFFNNQKAGGLILIFSTLLSLILANSGASSLYSAFWNFEIAQHSVTHWINDGLMAIFFLLIGLELEREIYIGELSSIKKSLLPVLAAIGGMIAPAILHLAFNFGSETQSGAGIPMATDIAFALGVLSLLGKRVPISLKIFLTALAVIDDLGAILVIAIFYTNTIDVINLFLTLGIFGVLLILNRLKVHNLIPYLIGGILMWYFMLHSGIHATVTGVLLAFAIPFGDGKEKSASFILQNFLHKPVAFIILPLFALANTNIQIGAQWYLTLLHVNSYGIFTGLVIGKPVGIWLFSYLSVYFKITKLPTGLNFHAILGAGFLGGIGFTMAIFITLLAFQSPSFIEQSKIVIMLSSVLAATIGYMILKYCLKPAPNS